jgi:hypothetical protein
MCARVSKQMAYAEPNCAGDWPLQVPQVLGKDKRYSRCVNGPIYNVTGSTCTRINLHKIDSVSRGHAVQHKAFP